MRVHTTRNGARWTSRLRSATLLGSALLAALCTTAPPGAMASTSPDLVPSPPGANDWSCRPSPAHPYPVVLLHGTFANRWDSWQKLAPELKSLGYCVYAPDYGQTAGSTALGDPQLALDGLAPVASSANQLAGYVGRVLAATGADKVDIVGHSQGGMMPNYYMKFLGGADKVDTLVGLAADNHGTSLDGIVQLASLFPNASTLLSGCVACTDQMDGSAFLHKLNGVADTVPGVHYTVISTAYDTIATPYQSQFLSGPDVDNVVVQSQCPLDVTDHLGIVNDPTALHLVTNALDPQHATPVTCD